MEKHKNYFFVVVTLCDNSLTGAQRNSNIASRENKIQKMIFFLFGDCHLSTLDNFLFVKKIYCEIMNRS